jgi:hypothetical protein
MVRFGLIQTESYGPVHKQSKMFKIGPKIRSTVHFIKCYLITGPVRSKNNVKLSVRFNYAAVIKTAHLPFIITHFTSFNTAHIYSIVKKVNLKGR